MSKRLHEVLAIEKGLKQRSYSKIDDMQKVLPKQDLFNGHTRAYQPLQDDGERFEPENKKVQFYALEMLNDYVELRKEVFDIELTKDITNGTARADIVIDEKVIANEVPATTLLFLEKELTDVRTFVQAIPTLDAAEDWKPVIDNAYLFRTEPQKTQRTKKVEKPLVLYEATKEHPAQTKTVTEDIVVGHWLTTKITSAMPAKVKMELWKRVNALLDGVKAARERANTIIAIEQKIGGEIFNYILLG